MSVSNFNSFTMNNKLLAVLDMFEAGYPTHLVTSCQAWDDLTCDEQMLVEAEIIEIYVEQ